MKFLLQFACFSLLIVSLKLSAQQHIDHTFYSDAFQAERTVRVFLPKIYFRDSSSTYISTYVLDAQDDQLWNMATGNIDYLTSRYTVIPMIAIGIVSEDRSDEFNPASTELHKHLREEVIPLIESSYRVQGLRTVIGHSWGGAFIGNTLFSNESDLFDGYLGISPSFGAEQGIIYEQADSLLKANHDFKKYFYFSSGDVGFEKEYEAEVAQMKSLLEKYPNKSLVWNAELFNAMDHFSGLIPAINQGLTKMSRNYFADQFNIEEFAQNKTRGIEEQYHEFYTSRDDIFGYSFKPSVNYLKFVADDFLEAEELNSAAQTYELALSIDPENVKVMFSLADVLNQLGNYNAAKVKIEKALVLLEEQKDELHESYYRDIKKWAIEKLEE